MDFDQIQKRLQWVEDDRRKEKDAIAMLENRLLEFEGGLAAVTEQIKEMSGEVTRLSAVVTRMDQFDQNLLEMRVDNKRMLDDLAKDISSRSDEYESVRRLEVKSIYCQNWKKLCKHALKKRIPFGARSTLSKKR
jgi:septal ring factor EnvC (AmiA/AmiB activator)